MKIAIISDAIYPYNKGGKEKKIFEITTRLAKKGHDIHIYTMKWWKENTTYKKENNLHLHAISPWYPLYSGKRRSFKEAILFSFHCLSLIKEDFDIIDADHMPHLVLFPLKLVCLVKRKKLIASWNEVWGKAYWKEYIGRLGLPAYYIEKASVSIPNTIISISELTTGKLQSEFKRVNQVHTVPMGIDYTEIDSIPRSKEVSDVIFAGRLLENKNVDVLIKSLVWVKKTFPKITCIIVGEGPEKQYLIDMCKQYRLEKNVTFINFLPDHRQLYALFKSSKVFAFPSTREGFGIVVLEAIACGIPAVVVDHKDNASKKLINKTNGIVIQLDEKNLAAAIIKLLKTNRDRAEVSQTARKYDWDLIANNTLEVYGS